MAFRFDPCEQCCESGDCLVFEDLFARADSDDLGDDWEVVSGSFDIHGHTLRPKTADAMAVCRRTPPDRHQTTFVLRMADQEEVRVAVDWQAVDQFTEVRIRRVTPGTLSVSVHDHNGAQVTPIGPEQAWSPPNFDVYGATTHVCLSAHAIHLNYTDVYGPYPVISRPRPRGSGRIGLGTGPLFAGGTSFANFRINAHRYERDAALQCPYCAPQCSACVEGLHPSQFLAEIDLPAVDVELPGVDPPTVNLAAFSGAYVLRNTDLPFCWASPFWYYWSCGCDSYPPSGCTWQTASDAFAQEFHYLNASGRLTACRPYLRSTAMRFPYDDGLFSGELTWTVAFHLPLYNWCGCHWHLPLSQAPSAEDWNIPPPPNDSRLRFDCHGFDAHDMIQEPNFPGLAIFNDNGIISGVRGVENRLGHRAFSIVDWHVTQMMATESAGVPPTLDGYTMPGWATAAGQCRLTSLT